MDNIFTEQMVRDKVLHTLKLCMRNKKLAEHILNNPNSVGDMEQWHIQCIKANANIGVLSYLYECLFYEEIDFESLKKEIETDA